MNSKPNANSTTVKSPGSRRPCAIDEPATKKSTAAHDRPEQLEHRGGERGGPSGLEIGAQHAVERGAEPADLERSIENPCTTFAPPTASVSRLATRPMLSWDAVEARRRRRPSRTIG